MARERGRRLRRAFRDLRQSGARERLKSKRCRDVVAKRSPVGQRGLVRSDERRALTVKGPPKPAAARSLLRLGQARRRDQRDGDKPSAEAHCEVVTVAGWSGLRSVSALAPC